MPLRGSAPQCPKRPAVSACGQKISPPNTSSDKSQSLAQGKTSVRICKKLSRDEEHGRGGEGEKDFFKRLVLRF